MHQLKYTIKSIDSTSFLGNITSLSLVGVSLSVLETAMRFMCLIASLIVAYVTYRHTQEKRAMLKEQMKIEKDKQSQALIDSAE